MNQIALKFITGVSIGIELYTGDELDPRHSFAVAIDLLILRILYVRHRK